MKHPTRWDFPKGHVDPGESDLETAIRELREETGITASDIYIDDRFAYKTRYTVTPKGGDGRRVPKRLVLFLGWLNRPVEVKVTEHEDYKWFPWSPSLRVQAQAIDPVLESLTQFFERHSTSHPKSA